MMPGLFSSYLLFLVIMVLGQGGAPAQPISHIYVFGDSLSDTGNVWRDSDFETPQSPPFYEGRFADGPNWTDVLPGLLDQPATPTMTVYAWGGGRSGHGPLVPGVLDQIDTFSAAAPPVDANSLGVIFIGTNDYIHGAYDYWAAGEQPAAENDPMVTEVLANMETAVTRLAEAGIRRVMIVNVPPFDRFPWPILDEIRGESRALLEQHNERLPAELQRWSEETGVALRLVDYWSLVNAMMDSPEQWGLRDVEGVCFSAELVPCDDPEGTLFTDGIHPNSTSHRHLAEAMAAALEGP